jgi:PAS domain S-box-containing protein
MMRIGLRSIIGKGCIFIFLYWSVLLSFVTPVVYAQNEIKFERVSAEGGGEPNVINCIYQDRDGFLWLGTSNGILRYDGYSFKAYTNDPQIPNSLSNNTVNSIYEDREGNLWVGTEKGLNKLDRETGSFLRYLIDLEISPIFEDMEGILWVGTYGGGLIKMSPKTAPVYYKNNAVETFPGVSYSNVRAIYEDAEGVLWIGTDGGGLDRFDKKKEQFAHFKHDPHDPDSISDDHVIALYGDKTGVLWIGTDGGLNKLDTGKPGAKFNHYRYDANNPQSLSHDRVTAIYKDSAGSLWIGTRGGGLNRMENEIFYRFRHIRNNPFSLSGDMVNAIYEDKSGILWIGTLGDGLNKYNRRTSILKHYYSHPGMSGALKHDVILSLYEDRYGAVWVGTFGEGLAKFDRQKDTFTHYKYQCPGNDGFKCNMILSILEDSRGTLWVGTDGGGLGQFDRGKAQFSYFRNNKKNPHSLSNNTILAIYEDISGVLWIGTEKGLNRFDYRNRQFNHYFSIPNDKSTLSGDYIMTLLEEPDESGSPLWVGVYSGGLNKFERTKGEFTSYMHDANNPSSLSNDNIRCIFRDSHGTLWIATDNGLNKFIRTTEQFECYKEKDGLPGDTVYGILEDNSGFLWLSTEKGLSRFDPARKKFKKYDVSDGTQHNKFNNGAYMKSRTGELFFGGINGFNVFDPAALTDNPFIPPIVITHFQVFNESALKSPSPAILSNKIFSTADEIILYYKDYFISIDFSALDFTIPARNQYKYKLEGIEPDWRSVDAGKRRASYMNLPAGKYTFKVLGSNNDGTWNKEGTSLKITVLPPYWETWWFRSILGVVGFLLVFAGYLWRTRWLRRKLAEQERVQKLLTQSRDEMEKSRDLVEFRNAENEKLITAISAIFIAVKANGEISQWNRPAEKFFGLTGSEAKTQSFVELLKNHITPDKLEEIIQLGLRHDKPSNNIEIHVQTVHEEQEMSFDNDREMKLLLASINPIKDRTGKIFGFLLLAEDITHRKREEMQQDLSRRLEALGQMAAGIAHEIRSPLQFIGDNSRFLLEAFSSLVRYCLEIRNSLKDVERESGQLKVNREKVKQILDDSDLDFFIEEIPKASEQIVTGVTRVSDIVKSMNEFAHAGDSIEERYNLNELLKSTMVVVHNRIEKAADVETYFATDIKPVRCRAGELNQVFLNILVNAADAIVDSGKRGIIKISTRQEAQEKDEGDAVIVEIADNGVGIPDNIKNKIFTPFFTTKAVGKGTGQGLHSAYQIIVGKYGGQLYFKSKIGEGTTFYIHFPIDKG